MDQISATRFPVAHYARSLPEGKRNHFAVLAHGWQIDGILKHMRNAL